MARASRSAADSLLFICRSFVGEQRRRPLSAGYCSVARCAAVNNNRQHTDRHLNQLFGAVGDVAAKGQRVPGLEQMTALAVPIADLAREDVDEFGAGVLEPGEDLALVGQGD